MSSAAPNALGENRFIFADSINIEASREEVYNMLWNVEGWPELLPHVNSVNVSERSENQHRFSMETVGPAGTHTTESIRNGELMAGISYQQLKPPPLLTEHNGRWTLEEIPQGLRVTSEHTIQVNPERIEEALGRPYSVADAALLARHFIGNHSCSTLGIIKKTAEQAVAVAAG